jgi:hypothetical protein
MLQDLKIWLNHFEYHSEHPRTVPAGLSDVLKPEERRAIASSIATFQLGEQSDGSTLLRAAKEFIRAETGCSGSGRPGWRRPRPPATPPRTPTGSAGQEEATVDQHPLVRITELFIREEQRHAALLLAFMEDHGIARKHSDWTDRVFRVVRRLAGFELSLHVLITAELIGNVYYRALEVATGCQRLKILCRTLVADELAHVGYESALLLDLADRKAAPIRWLQRAAHRTFFVGAAGVVWLTHRPVLRGAGYGLTSFVKACREQYAFYLDAPRATRAITQRARPSSSPE